MRFSLFSLLIILSVASARHCVKANKTKPVPPATATQSPNKDNTTLTTPLPAADINRIAGSDPYCNCAVDEHGFAKGWSFNDIWLDVVVILDVSESMGEEGLNDAAGLIESFIGDGADDFLITDESAPFYTRVGVISMSDKPEVLYNLNMTKSDSVRDKAAIKKGVLTINVIDAFNAALVMFNDGEKTKPERKNAQKVIYYITDADPKNNMNPLVQFKASKGVIMVNQFLHEGEVELPALKELASEGYYFSNHQYMTTLQSLCKANCFCPPQRNAYAGSDPAIKAAGGCYHPGPSGVTFNKANIACAREGGMVATIHDEQKGRFVNQLITSVSKAHNFWIGYDRKNGDEWRWADQSTDAYTNWAENEPSKDTLAKCAYVDINTTEISWNAGNCLRGLTYLCQYKPCSIGYKDC